MANIIDFAIYTIALFLATYVMLANETHQAIGTEVVVVVFRMFAIAKNVHIT